MLVHAYSIMGNHFHLVVESPAGELSKGMHLAEFEYAKVFNFANDRDGPLWKGRYTSRQVEGARYMRTVIRYVDQNAVLAGLAPAPELYPYGSAQHYHALSGPVWLERTWVEAFVRSRLELPAYDPKGYARLFGTPLTLAQIAWLERWLAAPDGHEDPLDRLLAGGVDAVRDWMLRAARNADGVTCLAPLVDGQHVMDAVGVAATRAGAWCLRARKSRCLWTIARIGLLRTLAAESKALVARRLEVSETHVVRCYQLHVRLLQEDSVYRLRLGDLAEDALRLCHPE
jgi:hypothetical protein